MNSNINSNIKNLSLTEKDDLYRVNRIPARNAFSTVKSSRGSANISKLNLKPVRLVELTQEILEAANEPLKNVIVNEVNESESDDGDDVDKNIAGCINSAEDVKDGTFDDLGVPLNELSVNKEFKSANRICLATPKSKVNLFATPLPPSVLSHKYKSPPAVLKSTSKPKIRCSLNNKEMWKNESLLSADLSIPETALVDDHFSESGKMCGKNKPSNNESEKQYETPIFELHDNSFKKIKVKNLTYLVLNQLGTGGSSVVYHCYDVTTKNERAIKEVDISNPINSALYINEVKVLERLQSCDRIVRMYDYEIIESKKVLLVVLEKGSSDFSKILKSISLSNNHLPVHMLVFYWMEMLYAVKQIHKNGIVHNDLKPGNFLRAEGGLKLIDFGIASRIQDDMTSAIKNVQIGSFNYISPEALINQSSKNPGSPALGEAKYKVSYRSDVWSLGCILYQLIYHKTPFQHIGHAWAKLSVIADPHHEIKYPNVDWVPKKFIATVKSCLQFNIKTRPSVDELIKDYEDIFNE